jgi:uncharacterized protein YbaP (TraB family)
MRWSRWSPILAAALLACASAPAPAPTPVQAPAPQPPDAPLLWHAVAPGGGGDLYLLGSVHLANSDTFEMGGPVAQAWERSEELVVEVDPSTISAQAAAAATLRHGTLPAGMTLADRLRPETWAALQAELERLGLPVAAFANLKPWMAATTLAVMQLQAGGLEPEYGIDQQMIGEAASTRPVVALESLDSQFAMLDSLPPAVQELMLIDVLERAPGAGAQAEQIVQSWRRGDEQALIELLFGEMETRPEFAALYEKVYFQRNEAMSRRLAELAADGRTRFTVLGVGHMVGPRGIPALLADRGFRVERLR